jgi:hypothetical protein
MRCERERPACGKSATPLRPSAAATPQPPPEQTRRVGAARRLKRRPRLALLRRARRGRMAPRCAKPRARPEGIGAASPRAKDTRPGPRRCAALRLNASTDGAATLHLVPGSAPPRRPFRRARSWNTRAQNSAALRVACRSLPYASRSAFRSFVAALRARAARLASLADCAGPSPRREPVAALRAAQPACASRGEICTR